MPNLLSQMIFWMNPPFLELMHVINICFIDKPGPPGQPKVLEMTARTANIEWTAPEDDGGSPITNYIIEMRQTGERKWNTATLDKVKGMTYTIENLIPEKEYEFRVIAENKAGPGQPSPPSVPSKYGNLSKHGNHSYSLSFK